MKKEEEASLELGFYNQHTVFPSRPPEILIYHPKKSQFKYRNTRTMISMPNILNILFLLMAITGLILYDITSVSSDAVSASSLPLLLPDGGKEFIEPEKSCDRSRMILTERHGFISSGPDSSNYTQNTHCEWLIKPSWSTKNDSNLSDTKDTGILILPNLLKKTLSNLYALIYK